MKLCTKCNKEKPDDAFGTRKTRTGTSLKSHCKDCTNAKSRAAYAADPAATIARTTAWAAANPERRRAIARDSMAKRRREQPEAVREEYRRWATANPEAVAANDRRKRKANPELYRAVSRRSQSKRRATLADAFFEDVDHAAVWIEDKGICHLCGHAADPEDWHLDHVVPLAVGGAHSRRNVAVSHPSCNQSKNDRLTPSARGLLGAWSVTPEGHRP